MADSDNSKTITVEELGEFISSNVSRTAGMLDREQNPTFSGKNKTKVVISFK